MKNPLFQLIASGAVLGMMGGAVVIHSLHVSGARELSAGADWASGGTNSSLESRSFISPTSFRDGKYEPDPGTAGARKSGTEMATTVVALESIVECLQELKTENNNLVGQLKETNRDLMELQFRIDSHSESFRPIRAIPKPSKSHLLLPPKAP